jgi:hypothetical protein
VEVTWADIAHAGLDWASFQQLVPAAIVGKSVTGCGTARAPDQTKTIPRKILELLRSQLDVLAAQGTMAQAEATKTAEMQNKVAEWSASVIDQAKRISDRKRAPAVAAEALKGARSTPAAASNSKEAS